MKEQTEHYELTYIVPGTVSETELAPVQEAVLNVLQKNRAQVSSNSDLGRRKLAYAIGQVKHGFYQTIEFDLIPNNLKTIEKELKLTANVLRFLIIKKKQKTAADLVQEQKAKDARARAQIREHEAAEVKETKKEKPVKGKVSLEDLDKKLDELLDKDVI